jgi:hypothetical protein
MTTATGVAADITRVDKMLKIAYADNIADVLPKNFTTLADDIAMLDKEKGPGNKYYQPVPTSISGGFTYSNSGAVVTLNQGISPEILNAELNGSEITGREFISYPALNRAAKGKRAFVDGLGHIVESLSKGAAKRRELALLYGGGASPTGAIGSLGVIESVAGSSGTTLVATITDATWNPATWIGMKDHEFDIYDASNGTTKNNTNGSDRTLVFVASGVVDVALRQVRFESDAANVSAIAAGDFIKFAGAHGADMLGLSGIHSVSTLYNIPTTNAAWKPQSLAVGGQLTYNKLNEGLEMLQNLGFMGDLTLYTSGRGYRQLIDDQSAFVSHANSGRGPGGGKLSVGWDSIEFHGPTGKVKVKQHVLMKFGLSYAVPTQLCRRIGSSDLTFNQPGVGRTLIDIPDKNAVQIKIWADQALYCEYPNGLLQFTGITG